MQLNKKPEISVLMPVYNAEKYLAKAVESILQQTFSNFEFVIFNDGSTDKSLKILQHYAAQDSRIRLISRENKGLVATLNEGISIINTPLIARMDSDDIALPDRFAIQKNYMDNHLDVVCVGGGCRVIDGKGRYLVNADIKTGYEIVEKLALQGISPICHPSAMIRTEALKQVGGYLPKDYPAEDLALWLRLSEIGKIDNVPEVVLEYRIHDQSISTSNHKLQMNKLKVICEEACAKRGISLPYLATEGRAVGSRHSRFEIILKPGWWAFNSREWKTAFIYGLKSTAVLPFRLDGWRLIVCALIKRPDKK